MNKFIILTLFVLGTSDLKAQTIRNGESIHSGGCRLAGTEITITHTGTTLEINISKYTGEAVVYVTDEYGFVVDADRVSVKEHGDIEQDIDAIEPGKYTINIETEKGVVSETFAKE
ncbi:MAG: DUF3244 domain-containing protein [Agathobacter sp.]